MSSIRAAQFFRSKAASFTQAVSHSVSSVSSSISSATQHSLSTVSGLLSGSEQTTSTIASARGGLTRVQAQLVRLSPFALLAFAQEAAGARLYVHDESSYPPVDYRFTYEASDFPDLADEIRAHISTATIESTPVTAFVHDSTPACRYSSAAIELSVEAGRAMSQYFSDGLDAAMAHMCPTSPGDTSSSSTPSAPLTNAQLIAICCVVGLICVGACVVAGCRSGNRNVNNNALRVPLQAPDVVVIDVHDRDSHHHAHDHHDYHRQHDHSTNHHNVVRLP
jgi:hypothetical protein